MNRRSSTSDGRSVLTKGRERQAGDTGHRVQGFLDLFADQIAVHPNLRHDLDVAVSELDALEAAQLKAEQTAIGETEVQKQMRADIHLRYLNLIGDIAKKKQLNDERLIVPLRLKQGEFLAALDLLMTAAPAYEKVLVEWGVPPDFLVQLPAAIDALKATRDSRARNWSGSAGATAGLGAANKKVRDAIDQLSRSLASQLSKNPPLLAGWEAASRYHRMRVEPRPGGSVEPPPEDEENPPS
jgi:hypothetical protein